VKKKRKITKKTKRLSEEKKLLRTRSVRITPTKEQILHLNKVFGIHRYIYNQCVELDSNGDINWCSEKSEWRSLLTSEEGFSITGEEWKKDAPSHTRQQAIDEFIRSKNACFSNLRNGNINHFKMGYRSKWKSRQETIPLEGYTLHGTKKNYNVRLFGIKTPFKIRDKKIPRELNLDKRVREEVKMTRTKLGYYYLHFLVELDQRETTSTSAVAMDPGVRTFQTWYSDTYGYGKVGNFDPQQILLEKADNLQSKLKTDGKNKNASWRRSLKRRFLRVLERVRHRTRDMHRKLSSFFCKTFKYIFIPKFETSNMLSRGFLRSKTCRAMQTWSHFKFRKFLSEHAQLYDHTKVRVCNEAYTTKQCGRCGTINNSVGGSEVFHCNTCHLSCDRDYHAARNILLRAVGVLVNGLF
jgi:putative transposase